VRKDNSGEKDLIINKHWKTPCKFKIVSVPKQVLKLGANLRYCMLRRWPNESFNQFCKDVGNFIPDSSVRLSSILWCWTQPDKGALLEDSKIRFFFATMYYLSAKDSCGKEDFEVASFMAMNSIYELGYDDGFHEFVDSTAIETKGALAGGKRGKEIRAAVGKYLVNLINEAPEKSIKKQSDVGRLLSAALWAYVLEKGYGKSIDADNFIHKSLREKGDVKDAYLKKIGKLT
jgi:hypothetical protein